jgi:hypothetical protein
LSVFSTVPILFSKTKRSLLVRTMIISAEVVKEASHRGQARSITALTITRPA